MTARRLVPEGEAEWARFQRHLEWSEGFSIAFVFSAHPLVVETFRGRAAARFRARLTGLRSLEPGAPADLEGSTLPKLLKPATAERALDVTRWLDLATHSGPEWSAAVTSFLLRLNEHREPLRRALKRPLVVVLPASDRERLRALVPDLWTIRDLVLDTGDWVVAEAPDRFVPEPLRAPPAPASALDRAAIEEWERIEKGGVRDRRSLFASGRAFDVFLAMGRFEEAEEVAFEALRYTRRLADEAATPEALRDLSVSLDNVGRTAQALGRWEEAQGRYAESLDLRRRVLERVGETPEALRDLADSLANMSRAAQALSLWEEALARATEAAELGRRLAEAFPDLPDFLELEVKYARRLAELERARAEAESASATGRSKPDV